MHQQIQQNMSRRAPQLDQAVATFVLPGEVAEFADCELMTLARIPTVEPTGDLTAGLVAARWPAEHALIQELVHERAVLSTDEGDAFEASDAAEVVAFVQRDCAMVVRADREAQVPHAERPCFVDAA